jgi:hypothetical protein
MATETSSNRTCVLERQILRAICSGAVAKSECQLILEKLRNHRWQEAEHRIVYEALERIPGHDAQFIKTALPAETTRMGFPDVDWDQYFSAECDSRPIQLSVQALVEELCALPRAGQE